jgi:hypothetical protein
MKLSYYTYFLENKKTQKRYRNDLRPFLKNFCAAENPDYKNSFVSLTDERMYLFNLSRNVYLFVMTKSHEIIKKIDTNTINVDEIYSKLGRNDKLGFASYIYFGDCYYGLASTMQGPRNKSLNYFLNSIIESLNLDKYEFKSAALMHQSSKADVLKMPFLGKTIVQVGEGNSFFDHMKGFLGNKVEDIDSFVIEIRPKRAKSINKTISEFNSKLSDAGLMKYIVRAKESQAEALEDFYIACSGGVSDAIYSREDGKIYTEIREKTQSNQTLADKIGEFKDDKEYNSTEIQAIAIYNQPIAWASYLSSL